MRWRELFECWLDKSCYPHEVEQHHWLYPTVAELGWDEAIERVTPISPHADKLLHPEGLFRSLLRGAHDDIVSPSSGRISGTRATRSSSRSGMRTPSAPRYRDALVRWRELFECWLDKSCYPHEVEQHHWLYPTVAELGWDEAIERVTPISPHADKLLHPEGLFRSLLRGAHDDIVMLTAALMLSWTMNHKQSTEIGARTAAELLRRERGVGERDERDTSRPDDPAPTFQALFLGVLRLEIGGFTRIENTWGGQLDKVVQEFDQMTEGRVVMGRSYTPSTHCARDELRLPMLAILLAHVPEDGDDGVAKEIKKLTETFTKTKDLLPEGESSFGMVRELIRKFLTDLDGEDREKLRRGFDALTRGGEADFAARDEALRTILDAGRASPPQD